MTFDPTLTLGAILIVFGQVGSIFWFAARVDKRIDMLGQRVGAMERKLDSQAADIKENSRFGERMANIEGRLTNHASMISTAQRDVADLRRGNGFIRHERDELDGEYS